MKPLYSGLRLHPRSKWEWFCNQTIIFMRLLAKEWFDCNFIDLS